MKMPKQMEILIYKIIHDALFLWLLVFVIFLIAEALLPGYLTAHIGFTKIIFVFFALALTAVYIAKRNNLEHSTIPSENLLKNKTAIVMLFVAFILIIVSLRRFGIAEIAIITLATAATGYYFWKIFQE